MRRVRQLTEVFRFSISTKALIVVVVFVIISAVLWLVYPLNIEDDNLALNQNNTLSELNSIKAPDPASSEAIERLNQVPESWVQRKQTFIDQYNEIAFQFPKELTIADDVNGIYVFPKEQLERGDLKISGGFLMELRTVRDFEQASETGEVFTFRIGSDPQEYQVPIYENRSWEGKSVLIELPKFLVSRLRHWSSKYIGVTFTDSKQLDWVSEILSTLVSATTYDIEKVATLSSYAYPRHRSRNHVTVTPESTINGPWVAFDQKQLLYSFYYPQKFPLEVNYYPEDVPNPLSSAVTIKFREPPHPFSGSYLKIGNSNDLIGFSTSGALCANTVCHVRALYLMPKSEKIMPVVQMPDGSFRGQIRPSEQIRLSVAFSVLENDQYLIEEIVKIIQSIKVSAWEDGCDREKARISC
jgi:hypothetical protein